MFLYASCTMHKLSSILYPTNPRWCLLYLCKAAKYKNCTEVKCTTASLDSTKVTPVALRLTGDSTEVTSFFNRVQYLRGNSFIFSVKIAAILDYGTLSFHWVTNAIKGLECTMFTCFSAICFASFKTSKLLNSVWALHHHKGKQKCEWTINLHRKTE